MEVSAPRLNRAPVVPSLRQAGAAALLSRGLLVVTGLASSTLLPLVLTQTAVGQFFFAQILIAGLGTLAQLGLTFSIPASLTKATAEGDLGRARRLAILSLILCATAGLAVGALALTILPEIGRLNGMHDIADWFAAVPVIALIVPLISLNAILVELLRSLHAVRASANLAAAAGLFTVLYLASMLAMGTPGRLVEVLTAGLVGWAVCVVIGLGLVVRTIRLWQAPAREPIRALALARFTVPNFLTTVVLFLLANVDILLLSGLGSMSEVAQYGIALRFSTLIVIPLAIMNSAFAPLGVQARSTGDATTLRDMLTKSATGAAAGALLLYAGFVVGTPIFIFNWYPAYESSYWLTLILGLGNVLHACGGSAGIVLMTWGDQAMSLKITLATSLLTVVLCLAGIQWGGMYGLALAAAFGNALQVAMFVLRVRRHFAVDPSILAVLRGLRTP